MTPAQALAAYLQADVDLTAQVPGGVWIDVAPQKQATPLLLVMQGRAVARVACAGAVGIDVEADLVVWAFGRAEEVDALTAIARAVQALVHKRRWPAGDAWRVVQSHVVELFERVRHDGSDARWHAIGRVFRVALQET